MLCVLCVRAHACVSPKIGLPSVIGLPSTSIHLPHMAGTLCSCVCVCVLDTLPSMVEFISEKYSHWLFLYFARDNITNRFCVVCLCYFLPTFWGDSGIRCARVQESALCEPVLAGPVRWSYRAEPSGIHSPGQMGRDSSVTEVAEYSALCHSSFFPYSLCHRPSCSFHLSPPFVPQFSLNFFIKLTRLKLAVFQPSSGSS